MTLSSLNAFRLEVILWYVISSIGANRCLAGRFWVRINGDGGYSILQRKPSRFSYLRSCVVEWRAVGGGCEFWLILK